MSKKTGYIYMYKNMVKWCCEWGKPSPSIPGPRLEGFHVGIWGHDRIEWSCRKVPAGHKAHGICALRSTADPEADEALFEP